MRDPEVIYSVIKRGVAFLGGMGTLIFLPLPVMAQSPEPAQLLQEMDEALRGHSLQATLSFDVQTVSWQRHYIMKFWTQGLDYALARLINPPKVEGQGFLRVQSRVWNYLPTAERVILIPVSLMTQPVLGSDFATDDLVKLSYLARDYDAVIIGEETLEGFETYQLELKPKPDAPVSYEKLEVWLRKADSAPVRITFYDEKQQPLRSLHYSQFQMLGGRERPMVWRMENHRDKGRQTILTLQEAVYDLELSDSLFTRENLEKYP